MSNRELAAEVIRAHGTDPCREPQCIAQDLADAGLITPDLPAPLIAANGNPVWRANDTLMVTQFPDGEIRMMLSWEKEACYTPQAARDQAALLLAAANHADASTDG